MPHYFTFTHKGAGIVLHHSDGNLFCPSVMAAEQILLSSINGWAREDCTKAREEMALLTRLIREQ